MNFIYKNENVLSLDLGTNSIGWATVNPFLEKIYHAGVNINPEGVNNKETGVTKSKAQERREARGPRKQTFRKKYLQIKLQRFLIANGLFPTIENLIDTNDKRASLLTEILEYYKLALNYNPEFLEKWNKEYLFSKYKFSINSSDINFQVGIFRIIQDYGFRDTNKENIVWEVIKKLKSFFSLDPYKLRNGAVENEALTNENVALTKLELGRIFYHLSQLRGFSSNRTDADLLDKKEKNTNQQSEEIQEPNKEAIEKNSDEKKKSKDERVKEFDELVYETYQCKTYGQFFYKVKCGEVKEKEKVRNEKNTNRDGFNKEFDTIWNTQKEITKDSFFSDENRKRIEKEILFYQRPLKSQKGLIGKCTLENHKVKVDDKKFELRGKPRCPISALPYEDFTMYSEINNMLLLDETGEKVELTKEQKDKIIKLYYSKSDFDVATIAKAISLQAGQFMKGKLDKHLQPSENAFDVLKKYLGKTWHELNPDKQNKLWIALYFAKTVKDEDEISCTEKIFEKQKIKVNSNQVKEIANVFPCKGDVKIYGCSTHKMLIELFNENVFEENWQIENSIKPEQVWQILFQFRTTAWNGKDENLKKYDWVKNYAREKWKITDENILSSLPKKIKEIKTGYGMLSRKAIDNILPYLKIGKIYSHAVFYANLQDVFKNQLAKEIQHYNSLTEKEKQIALTEKWSELKNKKWKNKNTNAEETIEEQISAILKNDYPAYHRKQSVIFECWKYVKENQTTDRLEQKMEDEIKWNYAQVKITEQERNEIEEKLRDIRYWHNQNKSYPIEEIKTATKADFIKNYLLSNFSFLTKNDVDKLYHPADIEKYPKSTTSTDTGLKLLESPHLPGLKNPVVLQTLHEVKHLVNEIIKASETDKTYKINRVRIEVSRELNDKNKRLAYRNWQKRNEEKNKQTREKLIKDCNIPNPSSDDILKYNLWQEMNDVKITTCPYCNQEEFSLTNINICKLFGPNPDYNIDHIIPDEISCDSTQENLILCCKNCNQEIKKKRMPSHLVNFNELKERFKGYRNKAYGYKKMIEEITKKIKGMSDDIEKQNKEKQRREELKFEYQYYNTKYNNLICTEEDLKKRKFKERQLPDTGFITKYALAYLKTVFPVVEAVKGKATSFFRRQWLGEQNEKDREQHLHHAEDAIIIGCMDKRIYDRYAQFAYEDEQHHIWDNKKYFPKPWKNFTEQLKDKTSEILVYYKQKERQPVVKWNYKDKQGKVQPRIAVRGQLHDAQFIGLINNLKNKKTVAQRVELTKITLDGITFIADTNVRGVVMHTINKDINKEIYYLETQPIQESKTKKKTKFEVFTKAAKGSNYQEFIGSLSKKEKTDLQNTIHALLYVHNLTNQRIKKVRLHWEPTSSLKQFYGLNKYAVPNNNYAGIFYKDAETIKEDVIPFYKAVELSMNNELNNTLSGNEFNILENNMYVLGFNKKIDSSIQPKELTNYLYRVQKKQKGDYTFRHHLEATLKNNDKKIRVGADAFLSRNPQKIMIDRLGKMNS